MDEKIKSYPKTEHFEVVDTIGVPHPFCIGTKHVVYASDNHSGRLGADAIRGLEKKLKRPSCEVKGCKIKDKDKLKEYLLSITDKCKEDGFEGFALLDKTGGE